MSFRFYRQIIYSLHVYYYNIIYYYSDDNQVQVLAYKPNTQLLACLLYENYTVFPSFLIHNQSETPKPPYLLKLEIRV